MDPQAVEIEATPLFNGLNASALRTLRARAIERRYASGQTLFIAGSAARGLFVILEGSVRVVRSRAGRQHVIHLEGPGGTLGEVPVYAGGGYPATAIAAVDTRCAVLSKDTLAALIADDPRLAWRLLERLALRVRGLVESVDRLATQDVAMRLAAQILARVTTDDGRSIAALAGTQAELAEEVGTVREVVVRQLRVLLRAGVLRRIGRGTYEVVDLESLRRLAGAES